MPLRGTKKLKNNILKITPETQDNSIVKKSLDYELDEKDDLLKKVNINSIEFYELKKSIIIDFVSGIQRGLRRHGVEPVLSAIENLDTQSYFQSESIKIKSRNIGEIANYICDVVVSDFKEDGVKIEKSELFSKTSKRGEVTLARKLSMILIKEFLEISDKKIAKFFGRARQVVFYAFKEFKNMDVKNRVDLKFLKRYNKLSKFISEFINRKD